MSVGKIPPREAQELATCFRAHASDLFGRACVLTRGDLALAHDLVQAAFEAAGGAWQVLGDLAEEQRRSWLGGRSPISLWTASAARRPSATGCPDRGPATGRSRPTLPEQALSSIALERCWRIIQGLPEHQHAVALLRWGLDMKESEIATVLDMDEKTVSVHLYRVRRKLILQASGRAIRLTVATRKGQRREGRRPQTGSSEEDVLLSRLYHQVTELRVPQFGAGYDLEKGLERYRPWLHKQGRKKPPSSDAVRALPVSVVTEWNADRAVIQLYSQHYRALVRLAAHAGAGHPTAEEVVQDSFVAMHDGWQRLRDTEKALAYLRQAVVNRSRSVLRHRTVVNKNLQKALPDMPSTEHGAYGAVRAFEPWWPRCVTCRTGSVRQSCCGTTVTCPRRRSRPRWGSAAAR